MKCSRGRHYDPGEIVDAPEHYQYSQAFGILTQGPWDDRVRPFQERVGEFVRSFPPEDPMRYSSGGGPARSTKGSVGSGAEFFRLARFRVMDWRSGSFYELLARYGLKARGGPVRRASAFEPSTSRDAATRRNIKLRLLHGGVDVEASNMDAHKAAYLDREESKRAAREVRAAVRRMHEELAEDDGGRQD